MLLLINNHRRAHDTSFGSGVDIYCRRAVVISTTVAPIHNTQEQTITSHGQRAGTSACDLYRTPVPTDSCRNELSDFAAALANRSFCEDAAWHALAANEFCSTMQRLEAQFESVKANPVSDFSFSVDVSPLMFDQQRILPANGSQQLHVPNGCYRTLASLSDNLSQDLDRNKCSLCSSSNRLLSYCYYLIFRAASLNMRVTRPSDAQHKFSLLVSRENGVDASTWVTGDYPKRVVQGLVSGGHTEYHNFHMLKHLLADCRSEVMVNIGANDGFYTFASSMRGCRTISFEPQIGCLQHLYFKCVLMCMYLYIHAYMCIHVCIRMIFLTATHPPSPHPSAMLPIFPRPPLLYNSFVSDKEFSVDSGSSCDGGAQFTSKGTRTSNTEYTADQEPWVPPGSEKVSVKSMRLVDAVHDRWSQREFAEDPSHTLFFFLHTLYRLWLVTTSCLQ